MSQQKAYYLLNDVISYFAPYVVYGYAGTKVIILHDHNDMVIVQDEAGNMFHSRTDNLSETPPGDIRPEPPQTAVIEKQHTRRQPKKKAAPITQKNLF